MSYKLPTELKSSANNEIPDLEIKRLEQIANNQNITNKNLTNFIKFPTGEKFVTDQDYYDNVLKDVINWRKKSRKLIGTPMKTLNVFYFFNLF